MTVHADIIVIELVSHYTFGLHFIILSVVKISLLPGEIRIDLLYQEWYQPVTVATFTKVQGKLIAPFKLYKLSRVEDFRYRWSQIVVAHLNLQIFQLHDFVWHWSLETQVADYD